MRSDPRTREYVARRTAQGLSTKEIQRCLKRYIVRELYPLILADLRESPGVSWHRSVNALAEAITGLYKAELIYRQSWRSRETVEIATLKWVHWFNHQRLLGSIEYTLPAETEANFYQQHTGQAIAA